MEIDDVLPHASWLSPEQREVLYQNVRSMVHGGMSYEEAYREEMCRIVIEEGVGDYGDKTYEAIQKRIAGKRKGDDGQGESDE